MVESLRKLILDDNLCEKHDRNRREPGLKNLTPKMYVERVLSAYEEAVKN